MKTTLLFIALLCGVNFSNAQDKGAGHKIVFQFTDADSTQQKALTNQLKNLTTIWPEAEIEVVVYNQGVGLLMNDLSKFKTEVEALSKAGVRFLVCENTMKAKKLSKDQFLPTAGYVPAGIVEIVLKQEAGWSYLKGGY